ncbi:MAG: RIP metalloprotease RseP [Clostridiales bacterium]|nr:RIP metalloprotease RseP [Candidatus Crickella equi]
MMLLLIAPHELGHFIVAKIVGVKVNEFAIGMGPLIWQRQKGETKYSLRAIPIGGYNAMEGEDEESVDPRGFNNQNAISRILILIAGVTMNVLIALLICIIIAEMTGVAVNTIETVDAGKPAAVAGLEAGDKIVEVDGTKTPQWTDVIDAFQAYNPEKNADMDIIVERGNETLNLTMVPEYNKKLGRYAVGITAETSHSPLKCIPEGAALTYRLNNLMFQSFRMLFTGKASADDVSGPVGLVKVVNQTASQGWQSYLLLLALVSLNLAFINMLPIPALDGGKILFVIIKELSRGRVTDEMETRATMVGITLLLMLIAVVTVNDIANLIGF